MPLIDAERSSANQNTEPKLAMNLRQFLLILRLRWWLVLLVSVIVVGVTTYISVGLPKVYTSQTSLLLDVKADPLVATFMPAIASPAFLATQSHIIRSDRVATAVVKQLGLAQNKEAVARWRAETNGKISLDTYFANMMQRGLKVEPAPGTSVLNITFTASDANFAAVVANAYAQAYIDFGVELRVEPAKQYATWFDQRLKELRTDLEESKAKLLAAQRSSGMASDIRADDEILKLNSLQEQLSQATATRTDRAVRARMSGSESSPDVQQSLVVGALKGELAKLEAQFADVALNYGEGHPKHQQISKQLAVTRQQLAAEMRRVSSTSANETLAADQKIADLRLQIEAQKMRVFGMREGKDDIELMARDVETAQRAYDAVASRRSQLNLESQSEQASARILSVAVQPLAPSKPNVMMNILASIGVGLVAGAGLACALELLDRRVRSINDLTEIEGIPVLAILSDQQSPRRFLGMLMPRLTNHRAPLLPHSTR